MSLLIIASGSFSPASVDTFELISSLHNFQLSTKSNKHTYASLSGVQMSLDLAFVNQINVAVSLVVRFTISMLFIDFDSLRGR